MSKEDVKKFAALVGEDPELAAKVKAAGTDVNEVIRLGREKGLAFTAEDMKTVHDETRNLIGEGLQIFMEKVSGDEKLARKLEESGTDVDEIIRLGKENNCEFTADNLMALQNLTVKSDVELSDEELEKVAGGFVTSVVGSLVAGVLVGAAVAGAAIGGAVAVIRAVKG